MKQTRPTFKAYVQNQILFLPPSLDELIPDTHPVRVVNDVISRINIQPLLDAYEIKGAASYHPQMLLKVIVYGYVSNIYSSRKLEAACRENITFMWLSGMSKPDHNTINRFRGVKLKSVLRKVFDEVVLLLAAEGLLSIEDVYIDGTKMEANANRYTFVWKKGIENNKEKMKAQLNEIWNYAQSIRTDEDKMPEPPDFTTFDSAKVLATVEKLNEMLKDNKDVNKKMKDKLTNINRNYPKNIEKYEKQEEILGDRNSFSKTDLDATFMRLKEDHMKNGQLKPSYNVQVSTSNQFVVNYTIHPEPGDTTTLSKHLAQHKASFGKYPKIITTDAGYGSEENYEILEKNGVEAYVKYNTFDQEQKEEKKAKRIGSTVAEDKTPFAPDKLFYNPDKDCFICPMGQEMNFIGHGKKTTSNGYEATVKRYQAKNCSDCPLRGVCHNAVTADRIIEINENLKRHRKKAHQLLTSEVGIEKRKKRCTDVEPTFGNIKNNHGFRRFMLRGTKKVETEWGLLSIAQNIRKKSA
jgi:transposase